MHSKANACKKNYDSWTGMGYPDPLPISQFTMSRRMEQTAKLAIRLRLNVRNRPPELFTGIFRNFSQILEELMESHL
jgi:hypothetical protein